MTRSTRVFTEAYSESFFKKLEQLLVAGRHKSVLSQLRNFSHNRLTRKQIFQVAALARRAGDPRLTLRLLGPFVRPTQGKQEKATEEESAVYSAALVRIGAVEEGLTILSNLKSSLPLIPFFKAHAYIAKWDYATSIGELERYLAVPTLGEYDRIIGQLNLAAAKVHERQYGEVEKLLLELETSSRRLGLQGVLGNTLEISAQMSVDQGRFGDAHDKLEKAAHVLSEGNSLDSFFVEKWTAILNFRKSPESRETLECLRKVRAKAIEIHNWETSRDCDFCEAIVTRNKQKLIHLYYGTPFEAFRRRIFFDYGGPIDIPASYEWEIGPVQSESLVFRMFANDGNLELSGVPRRALEILASDFYRPARVAQIFGSLYPGEYFRPDSSSTRVHQVIHGLRKWLIASRLPLEVKAIGVGYTLFSTVGCRLAVPHRRLGESRESSYVAVLREKWPREEFSTPEAAALLKVSRSTVVRELREAVSSGLLTSIGHGSARRYAFSR